MSQIHKKTLRLGIGLVLVIAIVALWMRSRQHRREVIDEAPPAGAIYYTGPRLRPNGLWVTDDNRIVPPPPGYEKTGAKQGGEKKGPAVDL